MLGQSSAANGEGTGTKQRHQQGAQPNSDGDRPGRSNAQGHGAIIAKYRQGK